MCEQFNGFPNYETYTLGLIIDNDRKILSHVETKGSEYFAHYNIHGQPGFADWLRRYVRYSLCHDIPFDGIASTFLNIVLSKIQWEFLAQRYTKEL